MKERDNKKAAGIVVIWLGENPNLSRVWPYVVPTGRVIATVSIKVPTGSSIAVSSSNAKFPYLKKEEYETWAMKMEYWIMNTDHNLWNIVLQGNEQIAVQQEIKARTILRQSLPEDHMADFHHLNDAKDIWLAVKARFRGNEESKKMRKSMLKQEFADFKILREMRSWNEMIHHHLHQWDHPADEMRNLNEGLDDTWRQRSGFITTFTRNTY
ncbi:hypothetical protein Tco_1149153 [Tanacetum coccineum]